MSHFDKTILVDCDGVLTDWRSAFEKWMISNGYDFKPPENPVYDMSTNFGLDKEHARLMVDMFNQSAWIEHLPPQRDAIKYVKKLHEEMGYVFHVITSLNDFTYCEQLRRRNLEKLFGPSVFSEITCLHWSVGKEEILKRYKGSGIPWIEDKRSNADLGKDLGLLPILFMHDYNIKERIGIQIVNNWKEIYDKVNNGWITYEQYPKVTKWSSKSNKF